MKLLLICIMLSPIVLSCSTETKEKIPELANSGSGLTAADSALLKEISEAPSAPKVLLKKFTEADVAKFVMASVMSQPTKIISVKKDGDIYIVSYTRPSDGQRFVYKVKIEGFGAVWGNIDGRWRDGAEDELIVFVEDGKKLKVIQRFSDGSTIEKEFSK